VAPGKNPWALFFFIMLYIIQWGIPLIVAWFVYHVGEIKNRINKSQSLSAISAIVVWLLLFIFLHRIFAGNLLDNTSS
jgi:hypothetical protein